VWISQKGGPVALKYVKVNMEKLCEFKYQLIQVAAVTCLPEAIKTSQYFFRLIYPFLLFFSSFFMLVTMLVYVVLPQLRNSIQGYSMICFLISLICAYLEYGVIFLIKDKDIRLNCTKRGIKRFSKRLSPRTTPIVQRNV